MISIGTIGSKDDTDQDVCILLFLGWHRGPKFTILGMLSCEDKLKYRYAEIQWNYVFHYNSQLFCIIIIIPRDPGSPSENGIGT